MWHLLVRNIGVGVVRVVARGTLHIWRRLAAGRVLGRRAMSLPNASTVSVHYINRRTRGRQRRVQGGDASAVGA